MTILELLAVAMALAMDALAVSIATGCRLRMVSLRQAFRLSWHFGLFQALMPVAGWFMGQSVYSLAAQWSHWIAFALLAIIGLRMLKEAYSQEDAECGMADPTKGLSLVMLSVATSIDALAVGASLAMLNISIWFPACIIGVVCFAFSAAGVYLGRMLSHSSKFSRYAEVAGGLTLLAIGCNILYKGGAFN